MAANHGRLRAANAVSCMNRTWQPTSRRVTWRGVVGHAGRYGSKQTKAWDICATGRKIERKQKKPEREQNLLWEVRTLEKMQLVKALVSSGFPRKRRSCDYAGIFFTHCSLLFEILTSFDNLNWSSSLTSEVQLTMMSNARTSGSHVDLTASPFILCHEISVCCDLIDSELQAKISRHAFFILKSKSSLCLKMCAWFYDSYVGDALYWRKWAFLKNL